MKGYLVLENKMTFEGELCGAIRDVVAQLVFTTGVIGYNETLTDPCFGGQLVMQTFPLIGVYGEVPYEYEPKTYLSGYVVSGICDTPSNFRCTGGLSAFLEKHDIPCISGVDTRQITRVLRDCGTMNAKITSSLKNIDYEEIKNYKVTGAVEAACCKQKEHYDVSSPVCRVALIDLGGKRDIVKSLNKKGCSVTCYPYNTSAGDIAADNPDGIVLSDGGGAPHDIPDTVRQVKQLLGKYPIFGISLGHQVLALAAGGETERIKFGHHGSNQPSRSTAEGGRTYITTQNHCYAVRADSIPAQVGYQTYENANDKTCEGMEYPAYRAFSVQFLPELSGGPGDTGFLYDKFIEEMKTGRG